MKDNNRNKKLIVSPHPKRSDLSKNSSSQDFSWASEITGKTDVPLLPAYGDLSLLNTDKTILNAVGKELLSDIVGDYNNLLETSAAVYEKNGDYALGIFSSSWCRFMDNASRNLCETDSNKEALNSGKWHCHESCWKNARLESIKQKKAIDIECAGGIRLYAIPITADNITIGSINFGYGNPPNDVKKLKELAGKFKVHYSELSELSQSYTPRSEAIIEVAKERLRSSARLIGEMVSRQKAQEELKLSEDRYKRLVENSPQISYIFSNKRGTIFWSSGVKKVLGYEPGQIIRTPFLWMESIFPDDKKMLENFLKPDIVKEGDIYKYRIYDKNKNLHWLKDIVIKVTKKENETIYEGIVIDETDSVNRNKDLQLALLSIESSSTSVIWTKFNGELFYANEIAYKSLGYSKEEFFRLKVQDYDLEWNKSSGENILNSELKKNGIHKIESRYKRKDGSVFPVKITTHLIRYENENYLYTYIEDISEQKDREKRISDSEAEMRFLANSAIELLEKKAVKDIFNYLADKIFHLLEGKAIITVSEFETNYDRYTVKKVSGVNRSLLSISKILGFDIEGMSGKIDTSTTEKLTEGKLCPLPDNLSEISNGIIPEKANEALKKLLHLKDIHSISIKYKDGLIGNVTIIRSSNCKDLNFKLIEAFIFQVSLFISKLIATKDLEESQARLKNLIANLQGVVYRCRNDENWTMSYLNDEIHNLSGFSKEEMIENKLISYNELIHPEDRERVRVEIIDALKSGDHFSTEYRIQTKSGATKWVFEKGLGIKDINGKYSQLEGFITDITSIKENQQRISDQLKKIQEINLDLKKAKERAEESDKLKSAFLANMSHEIRTPMNSILGFSEMLGTKELNPEKKERFILNITHSGEQLLRIIDDIIDISKIESNQLSLSLKNCDIDVSINEVLENLENSKIRKLKPDLYLKFIPNKKLKNIIFETDSIRFRQILFNLISNAIKFTEHGGVEIGYKIVYYELNSFLQFYVKDTGIGISEENRKRIFERFIQADGSKIKEGTGLGLSITKAIVELLGGRIWVESTLSEGSVFYFELPFKLQKEDDELEKKHKNMKKKDFEGAIIYIAEDDISSYLLLEEYLENTGAVLRHAQNGLKLLEMIKTEKPDLILLDINMPVLNGYQTIGKIRQSHPDLPVIAQTAYAMQNEKRAILEAGCNDYISKPIKKDDLIDQISKLL